MSINIDGGQKLAEFVTEHPNLLIITGAGCSAASGIPTYRNGLGEWQRSPPIQHHEFIDDVTMQQRYWARSMLGWPTVHQAEPNVAHDSLVLLEKKGYCKLLVTQNVDRLHQKAGQVNVIDLHGRLDQVICLDCRQVFDRQFIQQKLQALNPHVPTETVQTETSRLAPDGDAEVENNLIASLKIPDCDRCSGTLKPNVVFYGGTVGKALVQSIYDTLDSVDGLIIVGSSMMVFSSYRFCRRAYELGIPMAAVNKGTTRADNMLSLKIDQLCQPVLRQLLAKI